ncbi:MAG: caspase family protein [Campylobacterota bacterium]|nr:caspase family protein [Campylobacterota bacterium]
MRSLVMVLIGFIFVGCTPQYNRVALVVGNQSYPTKALQNPINDAKSISKTLKSLGFDVLMLTDLSKEGFDRALARFQSKIDGNTTTFFYFSGHANTLHPNSNETFMVMVDRDKEVLVSIHKLYETLRKAKAKNNIIAIDACQSYSNKNAKVSKELYRGYDLSVVKTQLPREIDQGYSYKKPVSTIQSYATRINELAHDAGIHDKSLSPYAYYLSRHLDDEEIPIEMVFRRIRQAMQKDYHGSQENFESGALMHSIYLQPKRKENSSVNPF